jgi:hypothetical protein
MAVTDTVSNINTQYQKIEYLLKHVNDVYNYVKLNKDSDKNLANDIINGLLNEIHKEFYSMVEETKTNDEILNYNNCLITLLAASSIDLCEAILINGNDDVINDFYERWKVLYNKTHQYRNYQ